MRFESTKTLMLFLMLLLFASQSMASVVYVDWNSPGPTYDGRSWNTAFHFVSTGLTVARPGDQVWVAEGQYPVSELALKEGVALYGGFSGTETSIDQRDYTIYQTTLDGQRSGNTIYAAAGLTSSAVMDGFYVTNGTGNPNAYGNTRGGGIYCLGSPTITHNYFFANEAMFAGGVYVGPTCSPVIAYNTITDNDAYAGGGICVASTGSPYIANNYIVANTATAGGGICIFDGGSIITNNIIALNGAGDEGGGGIYIESSGDTNKIVNNTIVDNTVPAGADGGGIMVYDTVHLISNNIIAYCSSGIYSETLTPVLNTNCVYGNEDYQYSPDSLPHPTDKLVPPMFRDYLGGDYHLLSSSTLIGQGTLADVIPDWPDIDGQNRVNDAVEIGADEVYTAQAPVISPNSGVQSGDTTITITAPDNGVTIRYTTNGDTPTRYYGTIYTGPFTVNEQDVKAIAYSYALNDSSVAETTFTWALAAPTFDPPAGVYASPFTVVISTASPGATIHYTTNGSTPTASSPEYTTPINIITTTTLKAIAVKTGWANSAVSTAAYTIANPGPSLIGLSPSSGSLQTGVVYLITAQYFDSDGCSALNDCYLLINTSMATKRAIYLTYNQKVGKVYIRNDEDTLWRGGYQPGTNVTMSNSRATVVVRNTTVTKSLGLVTVQWAICISPSLSGTIENVYLKVNDCKWRTVGWQKFGVYSLL